MEAVVVLRARRALNLLLILLLAIPLAAQSVQAAPPWGESQWSEHYFPAGDTPPDSLTMLHADVLRPAGLTDEDRTPVILTVSPYQNHSGVPLAAPYDPVNFSGPSDRFYDFLDLSRILEQGYTYVMVDLPGFGGSGGCNDWGGAREQGAVKAAVEWAASQPWSTGKVGMIGKSYDAWTGLMGIAQEPEGLAAVVAMEPVYSGYRYGYNNGVRFTNSVLTPALFTVFDIQPGSVHDDPRYHLNGAPQAWCYGVNLGLQQQDDPEAGYWVERDLLRHTQGKTTPLFLTQGFLERNTKPDGSVEFFNNLGGEHNRAWFGQFDHDRGWDKTGDRYNMGREVFVEEAMRFFDTHVKGIPAAETGLDQDPRWAVQDNTGAYRAEESWPPADTTLRWSELNVGTYADNNGNRGTGNGAGQGIWSVSQPLEHDARLVGEPLIEAVVNTSVPRTNFVANVYDIDPDGMATMINRGTWLVRGTGSQTLQFELYGQDWLLREGHRVGVVLSGANSEWWVHVPTRQNVTVESAKIGLSFLGQERTEFLDGGSTPRLESHLATSFSVPAAAMDDAREFDLPPAMTSPPAAEEPVPAE
jgi:uncharacterized protein